jgi:N-acetylglucosaminyl-diphospho-decaprenol L-rhamnosyltransferase
MPHVAVVIVTHNSGAEIGGCLDALTAVEDRSIEIDTVVVDNASSDQTLAEAADHAGSTRVRFIANTSNAGFAAAVNQGVCASDAPLILLLNPDAHLVTGLEALTAYFEDPRTGAAGGLLTDAGGRPQIGFMVRNLPTPAALIFEVLGINRLWPRNPVNWHYRCLGIDPMKPGLVQQPAGAFLMFSRKAWEQLGGFDARFRPVWFEDVDFCARLLKAGFYVHYDPKAVAAHAGAHVIRNLALENRERYWYGSVLEYAAKHYHAIAYRSVCFAVFSGAAARAVRGYPRHGLKVFAVYGAVCRLAIGRLFRFRRACGSTVVRCNDLENS